MPLQHAFRGFLAWRARHVSENNFMLFVAILVGLAASVAMLLLKAAVRGLQMLQVRLFENRLFEETYLFFPLIGILLTLLVVQFVVRADLGRRMGGVLYAIYRRSGLISVHKTWSHVVTGALTSGFGGSAGLEAPIITTGSAIGSNVARWMHLDATRRKVLIGCGAAAAMGALFNSPVAGVIFSLEVLLLELSVASLIPILLASVTGTLVTTLLSGAEVIFPADAEEGYSINYIPWMIALGVATALLSLYFNRSVSWVEEHFDRYKRLFPKALLGGLTLGVMIFVFPTLYGEGFDVIRAIMSGREADLLDNSLLKGLHFFDPSTASWALLVFLAFSVFFKGIAAAITIGSGGNGGYFAPALFVGALAGFLFARVINLLGIGPGLSEPTFALVAMAGMIAGVMHAPFTAIFFIAEISGGYTLFVPLMMVSAISFLSNKYFEPHSIFTKQLDRKVQLLMQDRDSRVLHSLRLHTVLETDLLTIRTDETLGDLVLGVAHSKRNIFPVLDAQGGLAGIIQLDDIRPIMFKPELYEKTHVRDLMHPPPAFVQIDEEMDAVMQKFEDSGAWNLPVIDDGKYAGMLSKSKIFESYRHELQRQSKEQDAFSR